MTEACGPALAIILSTHTPSNTDTLFLQVPYLEHLRGARIFTKLAAERLQPHLNEWNNDFVTPSGVPRHAIWAVQLTLHIFKGL